MRAGCASGGRSVLRAAEAEEMEGRLESAMLCDWPGGRDPGLWFQLLPEATGGEGDTRLPPEAVRAVAARLRGLPAGPITAASWPDLLAAVLPELYGPLPLADAPTACAPGSEGKIEEMARRAACSPLRRSLFHPGDATLAGPGAADQPPPEKNCGRPGGGRGISAARHARGRAEEAAARTRRLRGLALERD